MWEYKHTDELYHYGILGMKWGVRRSDAQLSRARGSKKKGDTEDSHSDYKRAHTSKSVRSMSDAELRERNNRLQMERQYNDLNRKAKKGKSTLSKALTVATAAMTVAKLYSTFKKFKKTELVQDSLDKIGDKVVSSIDWSKPFEG